MDITEVTIPTLMESQRAPVKNKQKTDVVSETVKKPVESQTKPSREMSPSPAKEVTNPNICIPEETIIDLTISDEEDSGSDTSSETDTAAESDESNIETVRVIINYED
ncbi:Hypothetical predicted protein [Mytilus galloprovincialis]|uniref:Uncharacterized protein n=1 Tax=Mytilus galloprovincialis TaxID=29158 RepID=A0A8B6DTD8_MYTGA|nr:Hypothetical predicted protein [Mytilus galloprovincialis]